MMKLFSTYGLAVAHMKRLGLKLSPKPSLDGKVYYTDTLGPDAFEGYSGYLRIDVRSNGWHAHTFLSIERYRMVDRVTDS